MKNMALGLVVLLAGCGKGAAKEEPIEAPSLSSDGKNKVPPGHETTYTFDGAPVTILYTWIAIVNMNNAPAIQLEAHGVKGRLGSFTMALPIPDQTPTLASLVNYPLGAIPGFSFGNAPEMATGTGATVKITEVTPTYITGTFEAQACEHGKTTCDRPKQIKNGTFKAFRSALSDDARFAEYTKQTK